MCLIRCLILSGQLHLSGEQLGLNPSKNTKRHVLERDWITCSKLHSENPILGYKQYKVICL